MPAKQYPVILDQSERESSGSDRFRHQVGTKTHPGQDLIESRVNEGEFGPAFLIKR